MFGRKWIKLEIASYIMLIIVSSYVKQNEPHAFFRSRTLDFHFCMDIRENFKEVKFGM